MGSDHEVLLSRPFPAPLHRPEPKKTGRFPSSSNFGPTPCEIVARFLSVDSIP